MSSFLQRIVIKYKMMIFLCFIMAPFFVVGGDAFAADRSSMLKKWNFSNYYECSNKFKATISGDDAEKTVLTSVFGNEPVGSLKMPSAGFAGSSSENISCQTLFSNIGINDIDWRDESAANELAKSLGYVATTSKVAIPFSSKAGYYVQGKKIGDGYDNRGSITITRKTNGELMFDSSSGSIASAKKVGENVRFKYNDKTFDVPYSDDISVFLSNFNGAKKKLAYDDGKLYGELTFGDAEFIGVGFKYESNVNGNTYGAANNAVKKYSGTDLTGQNFSNSEFYTLYFHYLTSTGTVGCGTSAGVGAMVKLKTTDGTFKQCRVSFGGSPYSSARFNTQKSTTYYAMKIPSIGTISMSEIIAWFNNVDESTLTDIDDCLVDPDGVVEQPPEEDGGGQNGGGEYDDECYNAGIDGVSWIACPMLTNLTYTAGAFDGIVDGMLQVKREYYENGSDAHKVWSGMRDIANWALALILLVIIMSQITGYGIDNYGIKKMLPKLIVMAILINFSFIICQLIIDLSNIAGDGLRNILGSFGQNMGDGAGKALSDILSVLVGIAGASGVAAGTGVTAAIGMIGILSAPAIILMIIVALIGIIVALVIFFASLGIRLMLIVLCVGIVPLAAVCYILPNTKSLFDKWWKVFKACLIIYPVCGAMMGLSELIKGIAWGNTGNDVSGVAMKLVALIAPYLPFFFLPTLLKGAIAAVGNLSGAINAIGDKVRGVAKTGTNAIRDSETYKSGMEAMRNSQRFNIATKDIDRLTKLREKKGKLTTTQTARLARAYGTKKSIASDEVSNQMALINEMTNNGENETALFQMYDQFVANNDMNGAVAVAKIAGRRKDTAARFMDSKIATTNSSQIEINRRNSSIFNKVAKEIATGDTAKNYRAADGVGFEYASQVNSGATSNGPDFGAWANSSDNIKAAAQHHITSRGELMGMKGSALDNLENYVHGGTLTDAAEIKRIEDLASQAIANRNEAGSDWDSTKAEQLAKLSGRYIYDKNTNTFRERSNGSGSGGQPSGNPSAGSGGRPFSDSAFDGRRGASH